MTDSVYCYPGTNTLRNNYGITDPQKLYTIERKLTSLRIMELLDSPISGQFDFDHLKSIHRYIFQDIYDWAGSTRTVDIAKQNMFCNALFIDTEADKIFGELAQEDFLNGLDQNETANRMAYFFSEINALHPFREGNGRAQREFIRCLALYNGFKLKFADISAEEMLEASKKSFLCNYTQMEHIFQRCLKQL